LALAGDSTITSDLPLEPALAVVVLVALTLAALVAFAFVVLVALVFAAALLGLVSLAADFVVFFVVVFAIFDDTIIKGKNKIGIGSKAFYTYK
jgi:hypothetical protein